MCAEAGRSAGTRPNTTTSLWPTVGPEVPERCDSSWRMFATIGSFETGYYSILYWDCGCHYMMEDYSWLSFFFFFAVGDLRWLIKEHVFCLLSRGRSKRPFSFGPDDKRSPIISTGFVVICFCCHELCFTLLNVTFACRTDSTRRYQHFPSCPIKNLIPGSDSFAHNENLHLAHMSALGAG